MDRAVNGEGILARLARRRPKLSRSEARVADVVLDRPDAIQRMNLSTLAQRATISEPTVLRFCRSLGAEGYVGFKIDLAQALASGGVP